MHWLEAVGKSPLKIATMRYTRNNITKVFYRFTDGSCEVMVMEDVRAGEVLWISGEVELSNELDYSIEVCRRLSWETGSGGITGEIITPEAGTNITPQVWQGQTWPGQHHGLIPFSGVYVVPFDASLRYVSLTMFAGGSSYTEPGDTITVDVNWGHLSVIRMSP